MTRFPSPPDPAGFNVAVWEVVRKIPPGRVSTYGHVAALVPAPHGINIRDYEVWGARWVGGAMAACPEEVPWHRVINSQGKISQRESAELQRILLEEEGVLFDDRGKVDL